MRRRGSEDAERGPRSQLLAEVRHQWIQDARFEPGTSIEDAYRRRGGRLLLLGEPGRSTTTALVALAAPLHDAASADPAQPVPVILRLSAWARDRRPLTRWLVAELDRQYGVAPRQGRAWLATDALVLLLDGLDEVPGEHRKACVDALNRFQLDHPRAALVVTDRQEEGRGPTPMPRLGDPAVLPPDRDADQPTTGVLLPAAPAELRWLAWLAAMLRAHGETTFRPDGVQPDWLPGRARRSLATIGLALALSVGAGAATGLLLALVDNVRSGLVLAATVAIMVGLAAAGRRIVPAERLAWSWRGIRDDLPVWASGLAMFAVPAVALALFSGRWASGIGPLLGVASVAVLVSGMRAPAIVTPVVPGRRLRTSAANALATATIALAAIVAERIARPLIFVVNLPHGRDLDALLVTAQAGLVGGLAVAFGAGVDRDEARGWKVAWRVAPSAVVGVVLSALLLTYQAALAVTLTARFHLVGLAIGALFDGLVIAVPLGLWRGGTFVLRHLATRLLLAGAGAASLRWEPFLSRAVELGLLRVRGPGYELVSVGKRAQRRDEGHDDAEHGHHRSDDGI